MRDDLPPTVMALYNSAFNGAFFEPKKMINAKIICVNPIDFSDLEGFGSLVDFLAYLYSGPFQLLATRDIPAGKEIISLYDFVSPDPTTVLHPVPIGAAKTLTDQQRALEKELLRTSEEEDDGTPVRKRSPSHSDSDGRKKTNTKGKQKRKAAPMTQEEFQDDILFKPCAHYPECRFPGPSILQ